MPVLTDDQKSQLADLYDEAKQTGDTASMQRIRSALQADRDANNPAYTGTNQYFDFGSMSIKERPNDGLDTFVMGLGQRFMQAKNAFLQIAVNSGGRLAEMDPNDIDAMNKVVQEQIDQQAQLDKPLNATREGRLGNMAGTAAIASAAPGAGYVGAATGGALAGATEPTTGDQSRLVNTAAGAAGGAVGQAAGNVAGAVAGRLISPIRNSLNGVRQAAVDLLKAHGVDLDLFQQTGDRVALTLKNAAADSPIMSPSGASDTQASQFTRAALRQMGVDADEASPGVMQAGKRALQRTYDAIASRNTIQVDLANPRSDPLLSALDTVSLQAKRSLRPDDYNVVKGQLDDIVNAIQQGNGTIAGDQYQNIQSALGRVAGDGGKAPFITDIRQALTAGLQRSANTGDVALLAQTNQRYAAMKAIEKAVTDQNQISPAGLYNALDTARGVNQTVYGQGANQALVNLAQAGKIVLGKGTPNSGTAQRLVGQAALGALGGMADAHYRGGGSGEVSIAAVGAAVGGPALARLVIENPKVANALAAWARNQGIRTTQDLAKYAAGRAGRLAGSTVAAAQPDQ